MCETQCPVNPEAEFVISCEPVKLDKLRASKYNAGSGIRQTFPFQKGGIGGKKGVASPKQVQNLLRQILLDFKAQGRPHPWFSALPSRPTGGQCHPYSSVGTLTQGSLHRRHPWGRERAWRPLSKTREKKSALPRACGESGSSDHLWIAFGALLSHCEGSCRSARLLLRSSPSPSIKTGSVSAPVIPWLLSWVIV